MKKKFNYNNIVELNSFEKRKIRGGIILTVLGVMVAAATLYSFGYFYGKAKMEANWK